MRVYASKRAFYAGNLDTKLLNWLIEGQGKRGGIRLKMGIRVNENGW
jgi:hypothetical protein